jgi:hypothetical protein
MDTLYSSVDWDSRPFESDRRPSQNRIVTASLTKHDPCQVSIQSRNSGAFLNLRDADTIFHRLISHQ